MIGPTGQVVVPDSLGFGIHGKISRSRMNVGLQEHMAGRRSSMAQSECCERNLAREKRERSSQQLAASVRCLEADDAARLRPAYMSVEDVVVRVADNLSVIDPFPLLHLPNPNVPAAVADFGFRGFAIARFLAVLLDASIAARSVRVPRLFPLGVKVLMERVVMFCLVMFGLVLSARSSPSLRHFCENSTARNSALCRSCAGV